VIMKSEVGYILVVDDNEMNRDMLSRRLVSRGHIVDQAVDGHQALKMIYNNKYDLILLDVMMPEISGLEVLQEIRQHSSLAELPVIMVTAKDQSEDIIEALKPGANDYVTKPIDWPVVSARVQTQIRLRKLTQTKDEFIRIASHDLKNPLTCILGFSSIIEYNLNEGIPINDDMTACIPKIKKSAILMQKIITDFLDFQAMEDGYLKLVIAPMDINEAVRLVVEQSEEYAGNKKISLHLELESDLPAVNADKTRISQVLENLVGNAIKFGSNGDQVTIHTYSRDGAVFVEVKDTGPGLSAEDMSKLFVKYARLSNKPTSGEKSSGLGLSICKELIEKHGGEIGAHNNPTRGATFWFQVPLNPGTEK